MSNGLNTPNQGRRKWLLWDAKPRSSSGTRRHRLGDLLLTDEEARGVRRMIGWVASGLPVPDEDRELALTLEWEMAKVCGEQLYGPQWWLKDGHDNHETRNAE